MVKKYCLIALLAIFIIPASAFAGVFDILIESEGDTYVKSFSSVEDMIDNIDTEEIEKNISGYTDISEAAITMNFRGVPIYLSAASGSSTIVLNIPSIGVTESFNGADRDDSVDMMEDWFKEDGGDAIEKLMEELAASTPSDPIAGNPNSLMSNMARMDFDYAVSPDEVIEMNTNDLGELNANMISVFAKYSNYKVDGVSSSEYALPLAYTIRFNNSKNTMTFKLPVSYVNIDGSEVYNAGLGLALGYHLNDNWRLTPSVGYGIVGSIDLGSVGQVVSGSLTSSYLFKFDKFSINLGNMAGYYKTIPFQYQDYSVSPDIQNTIVRNGLDFVIPTDGLAKGTSFEIFVTDTRYFGSELFIDQYNEIGFSYGFAKITNEKTDEGKMKSYLSKLRVGFTYLHADKAKGYTVNLGYSF